MSSAQIDPVELVRQALEEEKKAPPGARFDSLVRAGIIDEDGHLIRDDDEPTTELSAASNEAR